MRKLTAKDVEFTIGCEPEDLEIEGNVLASGSKEEDEAAEEYVKSELRDGNEWAWCTIFVTAHWSDEDGNEYSGTATLGACSYKSKADFMKTEKNGYLKDMKEDALTELNENVRGGYTGPQ